MLSSVLLPLGVLMGVVGAMHAATPAAAHCTESEHRWIVLFLVTPVLILLSPALMLLIMLLAIIKQDNQRLHHQKLVCRSGEAVLESAPQLCLQLIIVFQTLNPSWRQNLAITASALSLPIPNVEKYLASIGQQLGPTMATLKCFLIILSNSLFRIVVISILIVFFEIFTLGIILGIIILWAMCSLLILCCNKEMKDWKAQFWESYILSFLTVTNIGRSKSATVFRMVSTYYIFTVHILLLAAVLIICNANPGMVVIPGAVSGDIVWAQLPIVRDISFLNLTIALTITGGFLSLLLDLGFALCHRAKNDGGWNWDNTVLHMKSEESKEQIPGPEEAQVGSLSHNLYPMSKTD